jgi:Polyketide cyclase / dehydrase and lipid transport
MQTITPDRAETRTIAIAAPPEEVLAVVGDGRRLPEWAPGFAPAVRRDGEGGDGAWIVDSGSGELPIRLRVDAELGTVDILRREDPPRGAYARVVPNGAGSEFLFTLVFPAATDAAAVDAQMATVEAELRTVRRLAEAERALGDAAAELPPSRR